MHSFRDRGQLFAKLLKELEALEGDIAEFGVCEGNSTVQLAASGRRVYAFDCFEGLPESEFCEVDSNCAVGAFKPDIDVIEKLIAYPNVIVYEGLFKHTLPRIRADVRFMLVYLDADLYNSYKQVLDWIPSHLVNGAVIVCDDYTDTAGAKKAVDEFCARHGLKLDPEISGMVWK